MSGGDLFVVNEGSDTIGEYTTSGLPVNPSLISGLSTPFGIAVSGADLFVTNAANGTIGEYTTSGAPVKPALISGLGLPDWALPCRAPICSSWTLRLIRSANTPPPERR